LDPVQKKAAQLMGGFTVSRMFYGQVLAVMMPLTERSALVDDPIGAVAPDCHVV
jgi:hypothetical protein